MSNTKFGITYKAKNGLRTLMGPAQGRCMFPDQENAKVTLQLFLINSGETLVSIYGEQSRGTFRVDAFECYDHGDPTGIYVDD